MGTDQRRVAAVAESAVALRTVAPPWVDWTVVVPLGWATCTDQTLSSRRGDETMFAVEAEVDWREDRKDVRRPNPGSWTSALKVATCVPRRRVRTSLDASIASRLRQRQRQSIFFPYVFIIFIIFFKIIKSNEIEIERHFKFL